MITAKDAYKVLRTYDLSKELNFVFDVNYELVKLKGAKDEYFQHFNSIEEALSYLLGVEKERKTTAVYLNDVKKEKKTTTKTRGKKK